MSLRRVSTVGIIIVIIELIICTCLVQGRQRQAAAAFVPHSWTRTFVSFKPKRFWIYSDNNNDDDDKNNNNASNNKPLAAAAGVAPKVSVTQVQGPFDPPLLAPYWSRQPLLIRQAFDATKLLQNSQIWPSWQDIIDLACCFPDQELDLFSSSGESARLIQHTAGQLDSFTLQVGPFEEEYLNKSILQRHVQTNKKWTLLVNDVDRYKPLLAQWMNQEFGTFLPRWRRDDAQVSIAHIGGGIGPHVDNYDVFLVQASGQRTWQVGRQKLNVEAEMEALIPNLDVRILNQQNHHWTNYETFQLSPGDVLYLPPRVIHWGTADSDDCMTISVGCRAPSAADLVARMAEELATSVSPTATARYQDPDLLLSSSSSKFNDDDGPSLKQAVKDGAKQLVLNAVHALLDDDAMWDSLVGKLVTEPIRFVQGDGVAVPYEDITDEDYLDRWGKTPSIALQRIMQGQDGGRGGVLTCAPGISFATSHVQPSGNQTNGLMEYHRLFAQGQMWELQVPIEPEGDSAASATAKRVFARIEKGLPIGREHLEDATKDLISVLEGLIVEGFLCATDLENNNIRQQ